MKALKEGSAFDNRKKETPEALDWFRKNLYLVDNILHWGEPVDCLMKKRGKGYLNKPAGTVSKRGYIQVRRGVQKFMAHRIIWGIHYGSWPDSGIDHINGDRLDNRIENMRDETQFANCKNSAKYPRREPWIATGVTRRASGRWSANVQVNKVKMQLGTFGCHTAAMIARKLFDQSNGFSDRHGAEARVY